MVDVRINSVDTHITVADAEALLTPEVVDRLVKIIRQRMQTEGQREREADDDRKLADEGGR